MGIDSQLNLEIIKIAHIPIDDKQLYVHRWLKGGEACSTQLP